VGVFKNEIQRMVPRRNDDVNDTWMCDHGRLRYAFTSDETRVRQALVRNDAGDFVETPFRIALEAAADLIRPSLENPEAFAVIASAHLTNEESFLLADLCNHKIPAGHVALPVIRGDADGFLIQEEKAANATGTRAMGIEERGGDLRGLAEAIRAGTVKSLLVMGGDALSVPEGEGLLDVLGDLESLILITPNQTPISEHASVLIPGATFAEKDGSFTNGEGRVQWISRALNLPEGVETEGETLARIKAFWIMRSLNPSTPSQLWGRSRSPFPNTLISIGPSLVLTDSCPEFRKRPNRNPNPPKSQRREKPDGHQGSHDRSRPI
jgi:NADH-quinone oxidoreductase subunit G